MEFAFRKEGKGRAKGQHRCSLEIAVPKSESRRDAWQIGRRIRREVMAANVFWQALQVQISELVSSKMPKSQEHCGSGETSGRAKSLGVTEDGFGGVCRLKIKLEGGNSPPRGATGRSNASQFVNP
jgi:hypothetical protein